jgi:hypothetical protein
MFPSCSGFGCEICKLYAKVPQMELSAIPSPFHEWWEIDMLLKFRDENRKLGAKDEKTN